MLPGFYRSNRRSFFLSVKLKFYIKKVRALRTTPMMAAAIIGYLFAREMIPKIKERIAGMTPRIKNPNMTSSSSRSFSSRAQAKKKAIMPNTRDVIAIQVGAGAAAGTAEGAGAAAGTAEGAGSACCGTAAPHMEQFFAPQGTGALQY